MQQAAPPTIPTPAGGVPVAPQTSPDPVPASPDRVSLDSVLLTSTPTGVEAILNKLASSGLKKSAFVAFVVMGAQTLLGGVLAKYGVTSETLTADLGYAFDGGTVIYIVVSKWHDVQAGKIAAVVHQAQQAVQAQNAS